MLCRTSQMDILTYVTCASSKTNDAAVTKKHIMKYYKALCMKTVMCVSYGNSMAIEQMIWEGRSTSI